MATSGQAELKTDYPVDVGLEADEKHDGEVNNLVSDIDLREDWEKV